MDGIVLTRVTSAGYYGSLRSALAGLSLPTFTTGNRYLLSYYGVSRHDVEQFVWMRDRGISAGAGHGRKLLQPNKVTRHRAGQGGGNVDGNALDVYVGGFQIEDVGTTAADGLAAIGDSTIQGSSGSKDAVAAREAMGYLAGC